MGLFLPASEKFKHQNSQGPVVDGIVMAFIQNDLRCYIFWCTTERPCFPTRSKSFGKAEINLQELKKDMVVKLEKD